MISSLNDEPLPVCIPSGVCRFPQQWCLNDGRDHSSAPRPTYEDIATIESHLICFVSIAQGFLTHILCSLLPTNAGFINCRGHELGLRRIMQTAKYGSISDPELQETILDLLATRTNSFGFSLGELKALVYVASLRGSPYCGVTSDIEAEKEQIARKRRLLRGSWFCQGSIKYGWGGDLSQFKEILSKTIDFYENELVLKRS